MGGWGGWVEGVTRAGCLQGKGACKHGLWMRNDQHVCGEGPRYKGSGNYSGYRKIKAL